MSSNHLTISESSLDKSAMIDEESHTEMAESESHPASRKAVEEIIIDTPADDATPADFSEDEDENPV